MSTTAQACTDCQKEFKIIPQEQVFYEKKKLPLPTRCPDCRRKDRLKLRNERNLFHRKCSKCEKEIISTYRPESEFTVYCQECFWQYIG